MNDVTPVSAYAPEIDIDLVDLPAPLARLSLQAEPADVALALKQGPEALRPARLAYHPATGRYELLEGKGTWLAAQRARLPVMPAIVYRDTSLPWRKTQIEAACRRQSHSAMDLADQLAVVWGASRKRISITELATRFGLSRSQVSHLLRLRKLHPTIQQFVRCGKLSAGAARALVVLPPAIQQKVAERAVNGRWSARTVEDAVRAIKSGSVSRSNAEDPDVRRLMEKMTDALGAPVSMTDEKLVIDISGSHEILEGVMERLGLLDSH